MWMRGPGARAAAGRGTRRTRAAGPGCRCGCRSRACGAGPSQSPAVRLNQRISRVGPEQDRAVRHRRRHAPQLAQQRQHAALVEPLRRYRRLAMRDHLAPQAAHVRRRLDGCGWRSQCSKRMQVARLRGERRRPGTATAQHRSVDDPAEGQRRAAGRRRYRARCCQAGRVKRCDPRSVVTGLLGPGRETIARAAHRLDQRVAARTAPAPCAAGGCARPRCAPRRRRCRPRRGRAAGCASTRAPGAP